MLKGDNFSSKEKKSYKKRSVTEQHTANKPISRSSWLEMDERKLWSMNSLLHKEYGQYEQKKRDNKRRQLEQCLYWIKKQDHLRETHGFQLLCLVDQESVFHSHQGQSVPSSVVTEGSFYSSAMPVFPLSGNKQRSGSQILQTALSLPRKTGVIEESNPNFGNFTAFVVKFKLGQKRTWILLPLWPTCMAAVFIQLNVQTNKQNRKAPEWIQILTEQKERIGKQSAGLSLLLSSDVQ